MLMRNGETVWSSPMPFQNMNSVFWKLTRAGDALVPRPASRGQPE